MYKKVASVLAVLTLVIPTATSAVNLTNLNGLTTATQTFATSSTSTSIMHLRIQSSGSVHTFFWDSTPWTLSQGGTGTTTFATTSIPFINNGQFSATTQFTWDPVNNILNIGGTTTPAAKLSVKGSAGLALFNLASTTGSSLFTVSESGTTTVANGVNITGGCFAKNGSCITLGSASSSTNSSGTTGQIAYYPANGTTLSGTSNIFVSALGKIGVGNTNPFTALDVFGAFYSRLVTASVSTIDWSQGNVQSLSLSSNATLTFSNGYGGGEYTLIVNQDVSGSRTITWPSDVRWPGGTAPTLTTGSIKTDVLRFVHDGINYLGSYSLDYDTLVEEADLLSGLLSYWKFDETATSSIAADSSGNGKTLTNNASATFTTGKINNGADLERDSVQYFSRSNSGYYDVTAGTINCWIKRESNPSVLSIASAGVNSGAAGFDFRIRETNVLQGYMGQGDHEVSGATTLSTGTWYMATYVWDTGGKKVYLNGSLDGTSTFDETLTTGNSNLYIGLRSDINEPFDGMMDECGIWSRVLTQAEISALYNTGSGLTYPF